METIAVSDLRSNLMKVLKHIEQGSSITITSRGKMVAKLVPPDYNRKIAKDRLRVISRTAIVNDVLSPIDDTWEVTKS